MKILANYKEWLQPKWVEESLEIPGYRVPMEFFKDDKLSKEELAGLREEMDPSEKEIYDVYGTDGIFFHLLESNLFSFDVTRPPWIESDVDFCWEVIKMLPGEFIPVHRDILKRNDTNSKRFWVPMLDWQPGHIFMYKDQYITNYKAGDVFLYDDPRELHSAINLGQNVRLIMQVTTYKEQR